MFSRPANIPVAGEKKQIKLVIAARGYSGDCPTEIIDDCAAEFARILK